MKIEVEKPVNEETSEEINIFLEDFELCFENLIGKTLQINLVGKRIMFTFVQSFELNPIIQDPNKMAKIKKYLEKAKKEIESSTGFLDQ